MRLDSGIDVDDFSTTNIFSITNFKFYYHFYYQFRVETITYTYVVYVV